MVSTSSCHRWFCRSPLFLVLAPADEWPLPGQIDPALTPCALCRRRLIVNGKQVFKSCSCKTFGPPVTVVALLAGAVLVVATWWALTQKPPAR